MNDKRIPIDLLVELMVKAVRESRKTTTTNENKNKSSELKKYGQLKFDYDFPTLRRDRITIKLSGNKIIISTSLRIEIINISRATGDLDLLREMIKGGNVVYGLFTSKGYDRSSILFCLDKQVPRIRENIDSMRNKNAISPEIQEGLDRIEASRQKMKEERIRNFPERYGRYQVELHGLRTAKCYRCSKSLSTETHPICSNCSWIQCYCGSCGCNYTGNKHYR